jgi:hypothetical protein
MQNCAAEKVGEVLALQVIHCGGGTSILLSPSRQSDASLLASTGDRTSATATDIAVTTTPSTFTSSTSPIVYISVRELALPLLPTLLLDTLYIVGMLVAGILGLARRQEARMFHTLHSSEQRYEIH